MTTWVLLYILCKTRSNKSAEGHEKPLMEGKNYIPLQV